MKISITKNKRKDILFPLCFSLLITILFLVNSVVYALTFPTSPPQIITTNASQQIYDWGSSACTYLNYFYDFWWVNGTTTIQYESSQNGQSWSSPQTAFSFGANKPAPSTTSQPTVMISCTGSIVMITEMLTLTCDSAHTPCIAYTICTLQNGNIPACNPLTFGVKTNTGYLHQSVGAPLYLNDARYLNGITFMVIQNHAQFSIIENNIVVANITATGTYWGGSNQAPVEIAYSGVGQQYMIYAGSQYMISADGITWPASFSYLSFCAGISTNQNWGSITGYNGNFYVACVNSVGTGYDMIKVTPAGLTYYTTIATPSPLYTGFTLISADTTGNIIVMEVGSSISATGNYIYSSNDNGNSWTLTTTFSSAGGTQPHTPGGIYLGLEQTFSPSLEAFTFETVSTSATYTLYSTLIGIALTTTVTQTITAGSCPTSDSSTFTMVNSTIYVYYSNALGGSIINSISTSVASVTGSASQTLQILVYASTTNTANIQTPLNLIYSRSFVISGGTKNNVITTLPNLALPSSGFINNGALFAIGIIGTSHIKLNQSLTSGLFTLAGNPSTSSQPSSFTNQGTSVGTMLYLCSSISYQSVVTITSISTSTQSATTSTTVTVISTITTLVSPTGGAFVLQDLIVYLPIWIFPLIFAKLLGTTGLLYGLMLALMLGIFMGLFPYWTIFIIILMIYFLLR